MGILPRVGDFGASGQAGDVEIGSGQNKTYSQKGLDPQSYKDLSSRKTKVLAQL